MNNIEGVKEVVALNLAPHPDLPPQRGAGELSARLFYKGCKECQIFLQGRKRIALSSFPPCGGRTGWGVFN
jgi:hypothetical protein